MIGSIAERFGTDPCCPSLSMSCWTALFTRRDPHCIVRKRLKSASNRCIIRSLVMFGCPLSFSIMTFTALHHRVSVTPLSTMICRNFVRFVSSVSSCMIAL